MKKSHLLFIQSMVLCSLMIFPNHPTRISAYGNGQSLDEQAIREAQGAWNSLWTQCGDSHIVRYDSDYCIDIACTGGRRHNPLYVAQLKGVNFVVAQGHRLTEADRLNGVSWFGDVYIMWNVERLYDFKSKQWSDWRTPGEHAWVLLERKNSRWEIKRGDFVSMGNSLTKISCANFSNPSLYALNSTTNNTSGRLNTPNNVALGKPVQVTTNGADDISDAGERCNNLSEITDGYLKNEGDCSSDGVVGWQNHDFGQLLEVTVTINLQQTYHITKIRYNMGNVQRAETWNADSMITPFSTSASNPGEPNTGAWTEHIGSLTASSVKITFQKLRRSWAEDWLFIGEIEVIGTPARR